ncbi:MAG: FomA family porin-like outer membrane protein, partial [Fusobacteriaceae bacterium]
KEVISTPKEIAPTPVILEAAQTIEKKEFKVNGTFKQELEYFGNREGGESDQIPDKRTSKLRFTPAVGNINLTEKLSVDFRARQELRAESNQTKDKSNFRTRVTYKHGQLGDTKINLISRLRLEKTGPFDNSGSVFGDTNDSGFSDGEFKFNYIAGYRLLGDFKAYMPSFISKFNFGPAVRHTWNSANSDQYANGLGFDLETSIKLPLNLSFDTNVFLTNYWFGTDIAGLDKGEVVGDEALLVSIEAMLKGKWDVLKLSEKTKVNFYIEYGMDPYQASSEKVFGDKANAIDNKAYKLKARNVLTLEHKMTPATTLYTSVVGEYKNGITRSSGAKDWKWAPEVIVGWTTKF